MGPLDVICSPFLFDSWVPTIGYVWWYIHMIVAHNPQRIGLFSSAIWSHSPHLLTYRPFSHWSLIFAYRNTDVYLHMILYDYIPICMYCICMFVCIYIYTCVGVCMYVCIYIYTKFHWYDMIHHCSCCLHVRAIFSSIIVLWYGSARIVPKWTKISLCICTYIYIYLFTHTHIPISYNCPDMTWSHVFPFTSIGKVGHHFLNSRPSCGHISIVRHVVLFDGIFYAS